ncbi:MAG: class I SAM-dependent methyltransferase [Oligoflexales bacterium]|nr:class I SAM-dependent methyltransferase [Oligoflexales bacterium]
MQENSDNLSQRNYNFYKDYSLSHYYNDYLSNSESVYQFQLSHWELNLITSIIGTDASDKKILILGLGFGRELDHLLKLFIMCRLQIDIIDFNEKFINAASLIYNINAVKFRQLDLNLTCYEFPSNDYDFVIALNTLEYLSDDAYKYLFYKLSSAMTLNGEIIFRHYNNDFFFSFIDKRNIKNRPSDMPTLILRPYNTMISVVGQNFYIFKKIPMSLRIHSRIVNWMYNDSLAGLTWLLEKFLVRLLPVRLARSVYIVARLKQP